MWFESFQLFQCTSSLCRRFDRASANSCRCGHGTRDFIDTCKLITLAHNLSVASGLCAAFQRGVFAAETLVELIDAANRANAAVR